jgi:hypothetical protein
MTFHLAQVNIGRLRAPLENPFDSVISFLGRAPLASLRRALVGRRAGPRTDVGCRPEAA